MEENRIVCSCLEIDYVTIKKVIQDGAHTVDKIMEVTGAGSVCGGCLDDIGQILEKELNILNK